MTIRFLLILAASFIVTTSFAQNRQSELRIEEQINDALDLKNTDPEQGLALLQEIEKEIASFSDTLKIKFYVNKSFLIQDGLARFSESVEAIRKADELSSQYNDFMKGDINMEWGQMYAYNSDFEKAKEKFRVAIESFETEGRNGLVIQARDRLGNAYYYHAVEETDSTQMDTAKMLFAYNLKIVEETKDTFSMAPVYANYAMIFGAYEEYDSALYYYDKALQVDIARNDSAGMAVVYANMAINSERDTAMVRFYENKALEIAELLNAKRYKKDFYRYFAEEAARNGYFEKALAYQLEFNELENELLDQNLESQIKDWEITKENELQAQQIVVQNARTRNLLIFSAVVVILLVYIAVVNRRVTKVKGQLEIQNHELDALNSTKDKFFSIIAHDLRSPMIGLQGVGQKLDYFIKKNKQEKLLELGGQIDQSIDQLNHLLNNLLNWASSETQGIPYHPKKLELKALLKENIDLYRSLAETKEIEIIDESTEQIVHADANTVSTIIRNLLSNAIKFTAKGGKVVISNHQNADQFGLSIKDEGPGMDKEQLAALQSGQLASTEGSNKEKGFGLGLKLCHEFVELNLGELDIRSEKGVGSVFSFSLPKQGKAITRDISAA
jgi:signal transduction histidine kinase